MKIYKTQKGYYYKQYKNGKKMRISKNEYNNLKKCNRQKGGNKPDKWIVYRSADHIKNGIKNGIKRCIYTKFRGDSLKTDPITKKNEITKKSQMIEFTIKKPENYNNIKRKNTGQFKEIVLNTEHWARAIHEYHSFNISYKNHNRSYDADFSSECDLPFIDKEVLKSFDIKVSINKKYYNPRNFMDIQVKFEEDYNSLIKKDAIHIITSEKFMITFGLCPYWPDMRKVKYTETYKILKEVLVKNTTDFLESCDMDDDIEPTSQFGQLSFSQFRIPRGTYQYKLHISFNPNYLNEVFKLFLYSPISPYIKSFKILLLMYNHFYKKTPEWKDWNTESFVFKLGTGYFVIYLESNNALNKLSEFIEYWKYVFENDTYKYRDANYVKFNVRLSETLYFGYGGDTSTKDINKTTTDITSIKRAIFGIGNARKHTKSNKTLIRTFNKFKDDYETKNKAKFKIVTDYLKDTYSVDYNKNKEATKNGFADFYYWYAKNTSNLNMIKYGIYPYKWNEFQYRLEK